jgi:hypothetical protein
MQLGVRCGDLCKCSDCHNVGEIDGALPLPTALMQHTVLLSAASGQQQRVQHSAAPSFWPLGGVTAAAAAASGGAVTPGVAQAQAQCECGCCFQG